jgi:hypothetical protein
MFWQSFISDPRHKIEKSFELFMIQGLGITAQQKQEGKTLRIGDAIGTPYACPDAISPHASF